jgi:hypothetical protein
MPPSGGTNLGTAQGQVIITANTAPAQAQLSAFAQQMQGLGSVINTLAAGFGLNFGATMIIQMAKGAVAADAMATSFARQQVAADSLAGSQEKLNALLEVYDRDTGGTLDKATELANVTQLLSVGFADSTKELDQFATAIRGMSLATGRSSDTITQNLILELFSQRGQRLDQLGLQYDKVRARQEELLKSDSSLTKEMAYQQAVLDEAQRKYGDLAKSSEGAKSGIEAVEVAWRNLRLEVAQEFHPGLDQLGNQLDQFLEWIRQRRTAIPSEGANLMRSFGIGVSPAGQEARDIGRHGGGVAENVPTGISDTQQKINDATVDWAHKRLQLEQQTNQDLSDENTSYQEQRLKTQTNYDEQVTRAASDFAKQQVRQEEDYQQSIADLRRQAQQRDALAARDHDQQIARMQRDSGEQLANLAEDRDRTISQRRADFDDRIGKLQIDHAKDIAQKQEDSTKRLLQIDQDFNRQREQAALSHQNTLSDAAARLDAFAVFAEQQRFASEQKAALQDHDAKVKDEQDKLQESIDNANAAYDQKVADEKASLDKAIQQANDSYSRQAADQQAALAQRISDANAAYTQQLSDAHAADDQRLTDMGAAFTEQKNRQIADQADRMTQMGIDHQAELTQLDTEHGKRITQIQTHSGLELTALDTAFNDQLTQLGEHNTAWEKEQDAFQAFALQSYKDHLNDMEREGINAQIKELNNALLNPLLDPAQATLISNAITALGQALAQIPARVGTDNNPYVPQITQSEGGSTQVHSSALVSVASLPPSAQVSASGNNTAITIAAGAITISGVSGQTASELAGIIDQRIYNAVLRGIGRG